ncbi:hypothetical protein CsSME_00014487 [Camellia sinensis var. sinensis]
MKRSETMQHTTRGPINEVNSNKDNHMPIRLGNTHTSKKTSDNRYNMTIFVFSNIILFKDPRTRKLLKNTGLIEMGTKCIRNIFPIIIRMDSPNNCMKLSFNHL